MSSRCPIDPGRLGVWVEEQLNLRHGKKRGPCPSSLWNDIDPGWVARFRAASEESPREAVPDIETGVPGYGFDDAVAVFLAVRELVPGGWPGVIEVVVPLGRSAALTTAAPELSQMATDRRDPPSISLLPEPSLLRKTVQRVRAGYKSGYTGLPPALRDDRTNVVFRSSWNSSTRRDGCANTIHILGLASEREIG
jgi:hypothetical protein